MDRKRSKMGRVALKRNDKFYVVDMEKFSGHYENLRDMLWSIDGDITEEKLLAKCTENSYSVDKIVVEVKDVL